MLLQIENRRQG